MVRTRPTRTRLVVLMVAAAVAAVAAAWAFMQRAEPPSATPVAPVDSATPTPTDLPRIKGASVIPIPSEGPTEARGFPVPPWIKDLKTPPGLYESWQFDIPTDDPDRVIAFYKQVLPRGGYTVRTNVTEQLGDEKVVWDIVFDGPAHGTIVRDKAAGTVFVDVRSVQQVQSTPNP